MIYGFYKVMPSVMPSRPLSFLSYMYICKEVMQVLYQTLPLFAATSEMVYYPVSILRKSISGRHRPVRVADGPMTARCRFT